MENNTRDSAERLHAQLLTGPVPPEVFRAALCSVPVLERDAWVDVVLGLDAIPDDGPELPRGCVPYLPCPVDALLRLVDQAAVNAADVFVDVGAGVGRAATLVHLLTGASAIGLEIQPALVQAARELTARLRVERVAPVLGDATTLVGRGMVGSVFFLYCPFGGERLDQVLAGLEPLARTREIRVCCVDVALPPRPWLALAAPPAPDLVVYRSKVGFG